MSLPHPLRTLLPAAALACAFVPAHAIDLSEAWRAALANDANIRAARAAADARRERLPQSRAQLLPNISASVSRNLNWLHSRQPALGRVLEDSERYTSASDTVQLRQPIFRMALWADYRQAHAIVDEANANLEREHQNLVAKVGGAYLEALLAADQLQLVDAQKAAYRTQLAAAQQRLAGGAGTRTDIDEAQARLDLALAQELELRQALDLARRELQVLVEQPLGELARLDTAAMKLVAPQPDRLDEWTARAEANSPEIRALTAQREAARFEIDKARAGHYPTVDGIVQISRSDSDNPTRIDSQFDNKSVGLQVNIPIYSGGYVQSQIRQANADWLRIGEALEATRRDLGVRIHREFRGVTEGVAKVRALEQAVRSAEQLVKSSRMSFRAGARTLVDVLNAEQQFATAQRDLAQARYVYLVSRVRLNALAGGERSAVLDEINAWLKP
ncbi:TolC family outer membrane protein [Ramlibacter sp.]|uniref:TolC family outer membrane protein n=1 Tax=Ramlibacter sp. TaxID=1917967 RepID=UPI003D0F1375